MIVVRYTLTKAGKVPSYIINGGYFAKPNNKKSPQDDDFVGISTGNQGLGQFQSKDELINYFNTYTQGWKENDFDDTPWDAAQQAAKLWGLI